MIRWFRREMDVRGYDQPIWFDDAFPAGPLANNANFPALYPVTEDRYDDVWQVIRSMAREEESFDPPFSEARAWMRAFYASHTIKKVVTAIGEGVSGTMIGNTEDWFADSGSTALREAQVSLIGGAATMGLIDVDHGGRYAMCDVRTPGDVRPAWHNLKLLVDLIGDGTFDAIERVGDLEGPRGYRFERGSEVVWVLWNEDGQLHLPGDPAEVGVAHTLRVTAASTEVELTHAVVSEAAQGPAVSVEAVTNGEIEVTLTSAPVWVRER